MSSNIIFDAPASYISLLISVNGGQSKRKALFSTKGNPWNKDALSVSGALKLKKSTVSLISWFVIFLPSILQKIQF